MKTLTVRLPEQLVAEIDAESRKRKVSKSDIVRERLQIRKGPATSTLEGIKDLVGSVDGLPRNMAAKKKHYLTAMGYGRKRHR